jgi:DNA-binding CsgD family transcriptional regulator
VNQDLEISKAKLAGVRTTDQFEDWVRNELRFHLPHAAMLVTIGKLYGMGSVPTHRISIDFPLMIVESLKNSAGALDDPMMCGWFRSEKLRYVDLAQVDEAGAQRHWRATLLKHGLRSMMIHGKLDHVAKRFVVVQLCNVYGGGSRENVDAVCQLVEGMARAAWATVDSRPNESARSAVGHPTLSLTPTELHIVELLAQGMSNKEIARRRGVSDSTVKTQVQRTGAKLGATRRAEIVAIAMPMLSPLPPQRFVDYDDYG